MAKEKNICYGTDEKMATWILVGENIQKKLMTLAIGASTLINYKTTSCQWNKTYFF